MFDHLRYTLRGLRRNPGFTVVAVASLALGIGANTAIFSLVDQVLLRALPVRDPQQLVLFHNEGQDPGWATADNFETVYSYPTYRALRDGNGVLDGLAARSGAGATVRERTGASNASVELVSGNFFEVLGARAALGRTILPEDERERRPVVMLSYGYWTRALGSDRTVLNSRMVVNGEPMTVVGITDPGFLGVQSGRSPDLYAPLSQKPRITPGWDELENVSGRWLNLIGRLKPGLTLPQAQSGMNALFQAVRKADLPKIEKMEGRTLQEYMNRTLELRPAAQGINMLRVFWRTPLIVLMALVGILLLIACTNLANLLIARAAARQKELAIRTAVGAGRGALIRQLLTESLVLSLAAGVVGLLCASWAVSGLLTLARLGSETGWVKAQLDFRLFGFGMLVALAVGLLFGCSPLLQTRRMDLAGILKESSGSGDLKPQRLRKVLAGAQLAFALVLLVTAGLFVRTLANLRQSNPGFQPANVLSFVLEPRLNGYDKARTDVLFRQLRERLQTLPSVESVACAGLGPFGNGDQASSLYVEGYRPAPGEDPGGSWDAVSDGFFQTMRIAVPVGREFGRSDTAAGRKVAIINQSLADTYFKGRNPLGRHIGQNNAMEYEIVGVARNVTKMSLRQKPTPFVYFPLELEPHGHTVVYVRSYRQDLGPAVRALVRSIDPGLPVLDMNTMQTRVDDSVFPERFLAILAAAFGILASVLAAVGLYGVVSYSVARRGYEIGVRMAVGATRAQIYGIVLKEVGWLVAAGAVVGVPAAFGLGKLVESQLFGLAPRDPLAALGAAAALGVVALVAAFVPARRAAGIDPVRVLRAQ